MKKLIIAHLCVLSLCGVSAQEFAPGQQAKGYLDSKAVSVDHATGIFHYNIPLYSLKSGDFEQSVSLSYAGKEEPGRVVEGGLLGSNWTLNTGGVVTRMMRGREADEYSDPEDIESDIFVAVLGKTSVSFILKDKTTVPLERTNIRIEFTGWPDIDEWKITDDTGNVYYFRQKEWTSNLNVESVSGNNGISDRTYISAWFLSEIHPLNSVPIKYYYKGNVKRLPPDFKPNIIQRDYEYNSAFGDVVKIKYNDGTIERYSIREYESLMAAVEQFNINIYNNRRDVSINYRYGRLMQYRPFRINNYVDDIRRDLEMAAIWMYNDALKHKILFLGGRSLSNMYQGYGNIMRASQLYDAVMVRWGVDLKVLGMVRDFSTLRDFSLDAVSPIQDIYNYCKAENRFTMATPYLNSALGCFAACAREIAYRDQQYGHSSSSLPIRSPLLSSISCGRYWIGFNYSSKNPHKLVEVDYNYSVRNLDERRTIATTKMECIGDNLSRVKCYGGEKEMIKSLKFNYVSEKGSLLKSITQENTTDGVYVEYEPNKCIDGVKLYGIRPAVSQTYSIGMRLKRLIARHAEQSDTINYHYPIDGVLVYDSLSNYDIVRYEASFCDTLIYDELLSKGFPILKTGNNGLYYPYVEEEFVGRGKNKYLFYAPRGWCNVESLRGLPLAKASFDSNDKMLELEQWKYYTDLSCKATGDYDNYFCACPPAYAYTQIHLNTRKSEYNPKYNVSDYYNSYDIAGVRVDEYYDFYIPNIKPRLEVINAEYGYQIYGGGITTLKENVRYKIDDNYVAANGIGDFALPSEYLKPLDHTEYFYDNPELSIAPTRVEKKLSNGDALVQIVKNISELQPGVNPIIDEMRAANMLSYPVKIISAVKKNTNYYLNKELVVEYERNDYDGIKYYSIADIRECTPADLRSLPITPTTDRQYEFNPSEYTLIKEFSYAKKRHYYAPQWESKPGESYGYGYDGFTGNMVLKCKSYSDSSYVYTIPHSDLNGLYSLAEAEKFSKTCDTIKTFLENYDMLLHPGMDFSRLQQEHLDYMYTEPCLNVRSAIGGFLYLGVMRPNDNLYREKVAFFNIDDEDIADFFHFFAKNCYLIAPDSDIMKISASQLTHMIGRIQALSDDHYATYVRLHNSGDYMWHETAAANKANLIVKSAAGKDYKLFILATCTQPIGFGYVVNETPYSGTLSPSQYPMLQTFLVENQTAGSRIKLNLNETEGMKYVALVPEDAEFEAVCYNTNGTVLCKFDHTGKMEHYEYDDAWRVIKVFDHNGRIVKEYTYNKASDI